MILPAKHLSSDKSLLWVGAEILGLLTVPKTVSRLWEELRRLRASKVTSLTITYDWFILALDLLYVMDAIELHKGFIRKTSK